MNKLILLLAISILFQSCFSYKTVEKKADTFVMGKTYKIRQNEKNSKI